MKLFIKNIILYPKDKELKPRVITFKEDKINIITGYSQRGKSAIIDIIDYCLGSFDCNIPIGPIRDKVEVYALYLKYNDEHIFLGRENYEESKSTMYFYKENEKAERLELRTNKWLENKSSYRQNLPYIKKILNELAGFKNINTGDNPESTFDSAASFRDTSAFQFQTQNIIANPSTMFYKTDSWEHLQRLKTIFPLVLGYKSYEVLKLDREISSLESDKKKKENKLEGVKKQYENWQSDIYQYYSEAVNLGLTNSDIDISTSTVNQIQNELSNITKESKRGFLYKKGSANRFVEKATELEEKRNFLIRELSKLKTTLYKIEDISDSKDVYLKDVAYEKENRLKPIEWFLEQRGTDECPFCDSQSTKAIDELLLLKEEKDKNRIVLQNAKSLSFSFDNERIEVKKSIKEKEEQIEKFDNNLRIILSEAKESEKSYQKIFEFIGKIEHAIDNLKKISPSGQLEDEINRVLIQINSKKKELYKLQSKFDKEHSLNKLTKIIGKYITTLPIEDKETKKVHLDPDQSISIKIEDTKTQNKYFLSRLGSGANYMGYHISTMLGLHEFFYKLEETSKPNFVPSFIVFDQPSQVYYPDKFETKKGEKGSKDIEDTKKIFTACNTFMKNTSNNVQVIILEHVPKSTWEDINDENFHIAGIWRGDENSDNYQALIPRDWF
ncbi:DUF3732 domain-containing protein [Winogradskyella helgolandensis]|uniref:DUF3732 domain-containing protein n=1 Tax=Winogradskyella helgolandensis TaxID=2697010 RepID=UPI0015CAC4A1|nr:DUF3732 domain-containing protein [Winogradskyella helgolandensis]